MASKLVHVHWSARRDACCQGGYAGTDVLLCLQVLEMLEKGQTPPGIRTDIDDEPPNPSAPPPGARMQPRPKPWERADGGISPAQGSSPLAGRVIDVRLILNLLVLTLDAECVSCMTGYLLGCR